ncbi:hypothetical protein CEXT_811891 [Caerostris extrusa]|uniref:Uncharacterized protein n=1 Tax=Caerostris extrusa TaxID=172846 RepID=A0AAV4MN64_CAEEX|nr:hypothetical protein CEXT_811891 [Caerostris extrusa]
MLITLKHLDFTGRIFKYFVRCYQLPSDSLRECHARQVRPPVEKERKKKSLDRRLRNLPFVHFLFRATELVCLFEVQGPRHNGTLARSGPTPYRCDRPRTLWATTCRARAGDFVQAQAEKLPRTDSDAFAPLSFLT